MDRVISAVKNERIRSIRALERKKEREQQGCFYADGPHLVEEALKSDAPVRCVVVDEGRRADYAGLLAMIEPEKVLTVTGEVMASLSDTRTPQGILAVADLLVRPWQDDGKASLLVILDDLQDPGNMGTVIRTADAAGADGVLVSADCVDVHNPKCVRSTMGSLFHLPIWESSGLPGDIRRMRESGWAVLCGHLKGEDFFSRSLTASRQALVIGNEAAGIRDEVSEAASHKYRLAMAGKAESLNAAVAAGIMTYDIARSMGRLNPHE